MSKVPEVEDKYDVEAGFEMPPLDGAPGVAAVTAPHTDELEAVYFDTADLRLAHSKITLRRRTGGSDAGWHLKLPAQADRQEIQRPLGRGQQVPRQLSQLVFARTRGAELAPVARLQTSRTSRELLDDGGSVLASVADKEVHASLLGEPGTDLSAWREIVVELNVGDRDLLTIVSRRLWDAGARTSQRPSKLATVLGARLAATSPELPTFEGGMTPRTPAGEVIRSCLAGQLESILTGDVRVRLDEEEGIHDMRVATRRMRTTLETFHEVLDVSRAADLDVRLRSLAAELGVVRDAEVLLQRLLRELERQPQEFVLGPVRDRLQQTLQGAMRDGRTSLLRTLTGRGYANLVDELIDFVATGISSNASDNRPAKDVLRKSVARRYRKLARRAERAGGLTGVDRAIALHQTRKSAKQVRYAAEAVTGAFGPDAATFAKHAQQLQEILGEHQDSVVSAETLRQMAIAADATGGESAFTFGLLAGIEQMHGQAAQDQFDDVWDRVSRKRHRRWLK